MFCKYCSLLNNLRWVNGIWLKSNNFLNYWIPCYQTLTWTAPAAKWVGSHSLQLEVPFTKWIWELAQHGWQKPGPSRIMGYLAAVADSTPPSLACHTKTCFEEHGLVVKPCLLFCIAEWLLDCVLCTVKVTVHCTVTFAHMNISAHNGLLWAAQRFTFIEYYFKFNLASLKTLKLCVYSILDPHCLLVK